MNYDYVIEVSVNVKMKMRLNDCDDESAQKRAEATALAAVEAYPSDLLVSKEVMDSDIIVAEIASSAA